MTFALRPFTSPCKPHPAPLSTVVESHPDHLKIGYVRNPWDRLVSMYFSRWNRQRDGDFNAFLDRTEPAVKHLLQQMATKQQQVKMLELDIPETERLIAESHTQDTGP